MATISVAFNVIGPKILGRATDVIFVLLLVNQIGYLIPAARGMIY